MEPEFDDSVGHRPRSRVVFVHSRGSRWFFGATPELDGREVTPDEVDLLASAGFEIVEVNSREGVPLCATLAAVARDGAPARPVAWFHPEAWFGSKP